MSGKLIESVPPYDIIRREFRLEGLLCTMEIAMPPQGSVGSRNE